MAGCCWNIHPSLLSKTNLGTNAWAYTATFFSLEEMAEAVARSCVWPELDQVCSHYTTSIPICLLPISLQPHMNLSPPVIEFIPLAARRNDVDGRAWARFDPVAQTIYGRVEGMFVVLGKVMDLR
jgi:hypothetical protein